MAADILLAWAQLASRRSPHARAWGPVESMLEAATKEAKKVQSRLRDLLERSDQLLDPLRDPLHVDAGLNRWQRNDHEEAYSDWLAWILEQLDTREVLKSFRRRFDYT
jgi:hypothetical protein